MLNAFQNTESLEHTKSTSNGSMLNEHRVFAGHSAIYGMSHWAPEKRVTAVEIENQITTGLTGLDLDVRLGMTAKRVCDSELSIIDLAMEAVEQLLSNGKFDGESIDHDQIDLIIYFGVVSEYVEPATAVLIQDRLHIDKAISFDVSDACIGFSDAWMIADAMIGTGRIRTALLVSAEQSSIFSDKAVRHINEGKPLREHFAALSLGDGSCAILIGPKTTDKNSVELVAECRESYGECSDLCVLPSLNKPMITQAGKLIEAAISKFPSMVYAVLNYIDWTTEDLDFYVSHQASLPGIKTASALMNVPFTKSRNTIQEYGNMASVSLPFTLSKVLSEQEKWTEQKLMLLAFGSGLGVGIFALECK